MFGRIDHHPPYTEVSIADLCRKRPRHLLSALEDNWILSESRALISRIRQSIGTDLKFHLNAHNGISGYTLDDGVCLLKYRLC